MSQYKVDVQQLIDQTEQFVRKELADAEGGHDWWHIYRVWKLSKRIAASEQVDLLVVELSALLHDIADSKFHNGDENVGPQKARSYLESAGVPEEVIQHVVNIIMHISFKGGHKAGTFHSPELGVVQDADRLDAIGAIGIARAFSYGGFKNRAMHDPGIAPDLNMTKEQYKHSTAPTINHFYEKLLLLKDRMNTATGRQMAMERHAFMETFLDKFYKEWEGES
jgi:uncharacterized protein